MKPVCEKCESRGENEFASVVDHVEPHGGDPVKFWTGPLQSLCKPCHDGDKRTEEIRGYSDRIGADGYPADRRHPFYRGHL